MLLTLLRTRLALRSAVVILIILSLVGAVFLGVGRALVAGHEQQRQQNLLEGLLNTVDNTVRIAVFLEDGQLAQEVARGLVQNSTVQAVTINGENGVLAHETSARDTGDSDPVAVIDTAQSLTRQVISPFNNGEVIGSVDLMPNRQAIADEVIASSRFITGFFFAQLAAVAVSIVLVVVLLITRPIAQISRRLHGLKVETGEHLEFPRGNEKDEIGTLVGDVNAMIDYLVNILGAERRLRIEREREEKKFRAIVENAETGIFLIDASGMLISSNPAFRRLFSATSSDIEHHNLRITDILGESAAEMELLIQQSLSLNTSQRRDIKLSGAGGTRWLNVILNPIENDQLQGVANDITERTLAQTAAEEQAITDPLTGINNRLGFERALQWMIEGSQRHLAHRFSLLMLDLDLFKDVNDTAGHLAGDRVLVAVSGRITGLLRKTDVVARLGGDEFAIVIDAGEDQSILAAIAQKVIDAINQPIPLDDGTVAQVGASIGIATYNSDYATASELVRDADQAMYRAKHAGRNRYCFFESQGS